MQNQAYSDSELLVKTHNAAKNEKAATFELLQYLVEVDDRRAYATLACSSLFEYVNKILGYSEMQTSERVNSVRLMRSIPSVESKIQAGELSMSTASQVQRFLRQEKKVGNPISETSALEIIETCSNKSKREVEKTLFSVSSEEAKLSQERVKEVSEHFTELKFLISDSSFKKLEEVKSLMGCESLKDIFESSLDALLLQVKKKNGMVQKNGSAHHSDLEVSSSQLNSEVNQGISALPGKPGVLIHTRYISIHVKRKINFRSGFQCESVDKKTGQRCQSKHRLQYDHFPLPFSKGGNCSESNLRHLCFQHNQKAAMEAGIHAH